MHKGKSWGQRYRVRQSDKGLTLCHPSFVSTPGMRCQVKEALRGLLKATEFDFFKGGLDGLSKPLKTFSGFQFLSFLSSNLFFFPSTPSMSTLSPFVRISISTFSIPFSSSFQYHFLPYSKTKKRKVLSWELKEEQRGQQARIFWYFCPLPTKSPTFTSS